MALDAVILHFIWVEMIIWSADWEDNNSRIRLKNLGLIFSDSKLNKIIFPSDQFSMNKKPNWVVVKIMVSFLFEADLQQQEMREIISWINNINP